MKKRGGKKLATPVATGQSQSSDNATEWLCVRGATHNNLKDIDVAFPLSRFVCVTGVSGSGKSSLVNDILREQLTRDLNGAESPQPGAHRSIEGYESLLNVIDIDQSPIGRTPRSNPSTYIKVFDEIRQLFAKLPDSRVRGYAPGRFSFNVPTGEKGGGRCEACEGNGENRVEMDFLADVWTPCPICSGRRFNHETLQVLYRGKSIYDVLDMDVQQGLEHFESIPKVRHMLSTLHDVGLDYIKLGQPSTTLSGGEAQRVKLARELVKRSTGRTLYLLDEPTTGLHFEDIRRLLTVLHGFVDAGNTVVVIEHNLDVIKTADWVIDLGPDGGEKGGRIVAAGTPEQVATCRASHTGVALRDVLKPKRSTRPRKKTKKKRVKARGDARQNEIVVVGAREHNLKHVDVNVPRGAMTVCSGVSGSGKTSFAMDTVYVEGQRRYVESLSAYARQFLGQFQKPKVDHITGLSPAIAIEQKTTSKSPRSTVGTVTEIYDYMRVLWARVGRPYCPKCHVEIGAQSAEEIVLKVMALANGTRVHLCAPIERAPGETWTARIERCRNQGYVRIRVDGTVKNLSDDTGLDDRRVHSVEVVVDRAVINAKSATRIADSIEHCLVLGDGVLVVLAEGKAGEREMRLSQHFACDQCATSYEEITPHHLSFNSRLGWCERCEGLGLQRGTRPDAIIRESARSVLSGAIAGWTGIRKKSLLHEAITALARAIGFDPAEPCHRLTAAHRHALLFGLDDQWIPVKAGGFRFQWKGFFPAIDDATKSTWIYRRKLEDLVTEVECQSCHGGRVTPLSEAVRLDGQSIVDVCRMPLSEAAAFFKALRLDRQTARVAGEVLHEIKSRLRFLIDVGLDYLTLSRAAPTLSGGEAQRIRLASQIGSGLSGVLYVLDEPTIGLHPRDNRRLIGALQKLRDLGNSLLMVEHDAEILQSADHVVDFGPSAGADGGHVVAAGSPTRVKRNGQSLTGQYLSGKSAIAVPSNRRQIAGFLEPADKPVKVKPDDADRPVLTITGARQNNLKNIDISIPLGRFVAITGVSGSGKSSLITEILYPALASRLHRARLTPGDHDSIIGLDQVDKIINVDQEPIGMSPSSNPATYTGVFDLVRAVFAKLPESKIRGYGLNRFSFNRPGGRCDDCEGLGQVCHEMHFLPDVWVPCETCGGTRYQREMLDVRFKGRNIADVLNMRVSDALAHFENVPKIQRLLQTLEDVGLGYLPLGQSAPTLSGGEAQRVKLAGELGRPSTGKTIYLLDEPTTGLHFDDLRKLLDVLHRFVDLGNTVVCIEHNLDVIKTADWVIDLGPEAGESGGQTVAEGPPEQVVRVKASHTGRLLGRVLSAGPHETREVYKPQKKRRKKVDQPELVERDKPVKMPWERDGRRWHTQERLSRSARPVEWEGAALENVVAQIEKLGSNDLQPTDWNDQARVEIMGKPPNGVARSAVPWFLHALTGGEHILDLCFRVPTGTFKQRQLDGRLGLKPLDDRDDIKAYGSGPRVHVKEGYQGQDRLRVMVHDWKEINTPPFRAFLKEAVKAYLEMVRGLGGEAPAELWKHDGKAWHLSQSLMKPGQPKMWKPMTLTLIIGKINKVLPKAKVLWNRKVFVEIVSPAGRRVAKIITHQASALRLDIHVPRGHFTPTQVENLGTEQIFGRPATSGAELSVWFTSIDELNDGELKAVLLAAFEEASGVASRV